MKVQPINNNVNFNGRKIMGKEAIRIIPASNRSDLEKSIERKMAILPSPTEIKKFANGEIF